MKNKKTKKIQRVSNKVMKAYADKLWSLAVKANAGFKSELSGKTEGLNSHHLRGKGNYSQRYSLLNGFCCTKGEHFYGFHNTSRREQYEEKVKRLRGTDIFETLNGLKTLRQQPLSWHVDNLEEQLTRLNCDYSHIKLK